MNGAVEPNETNFRMEWFLHCFDKEGCSSQLLRTAKIVISRKWVAP